ncbi:CwfJ C-terminus 1-domain-containing protein-like protein [Powellomyces hirtus]|nr:CwfJ C-terminus 1-domain-containing protein-like protein [Powellomyces hirtus]
MEDCPTKMTGAPRVPPDHYVCRLCNVPGHYINDCPQAEKSHRPSGSVDDSLRHRDANQCWFCLSNPQLEKQLIVSVGSEVYLTLAKGGLVDWGGHMLIIPVAHQHSTRQMQMLEGEEGLTAKETLKEMEVFKGKLFDVYAARDEIMVCYELFGGGSAETLAEALQHMHLQVVPLPAALLPDLQPAFLREAEAEGLELVPEGKLPDAVSDMFCRVEIPTGDGRETKVMVFRPSAARIEEHQHMAAEAERTGRRIPRIMNLQFGRKVLASLLGNPAAVDWKRCLLPKAEEEKLAKNMRELVKLDV